MKKVLILLLCIFSIALSYPQVKTVKTVKVNVPSVITMQRDSIYSVDVLNPVYEKYIIMSEKDSTLYINSTVEITEPIKIRIASPNSLTITPGRNFKISR